MRIQSDGSDKEDGGIDIHHMIWTVDEQSVTLRTVTRITGYVLANTRPHHLDWGD